MQSRLVGVMSTIGGAIVVLGAFFVGWFVANLVTYHQLSEMSCKEVEQLKERIDWLEQAHEERNL